MEEFSNNIVLHLNEKIVTLKISDTDLDIDVDDILKIDYNNILGEILTFPVIVNKIGLLRAELENKVNQEKFNLEVYSARLAELFRKNNLSTDIDKSGKKKIKSPTIQEIENAVLLDEGYQLRKKKFFNLKKNYDYLDSLYWACKDKSKKLDYCTTSIKPEDFENELISGSINNVMIKVKDKLIK